MTGAGRTMIMAAAALSAIAAAAVPARPDAVSPDGRWQASIRPEPGAGGASGAPRSSLWLTDRRSGATRLLFRGTPSRDPRRDTASIASPDFSLDGGYVYVEADAYATSPAIHRIDRRTGAERYVVDGALLGVLRSGPWRGYLVVQQHRYRGAGGSYDPVLVYRPDGRRIAMVPGSGVRADVDTWLRGKGWRMR